MATAKVEVTRVTTTDGLTTYFLAAINSPDFGRVEAVGQSEEAALSTLVAILATKERGHELT